MTTASQPPLVLTIAGSDTSGGAGIQADIKTISTCGAYALSAITAITAQDPSGVCGLWPVATEQLHAQIAASLAYDPLVIKIGMLGTAALATTVADLLEQHAAIPVILDTVIRSSSGAALLDQEGVKVLRERLMPRAALVTPNRQEARTLFGDDDDNTLQAWARESGVAVLLTGGDSELAMAGEPRFCTDILITGQHIEHLTLPRVETPNHHGTGCTLTAAVASFLAHGFPLAEAVQHGRQYVHQSLVAATDQVWPGYGPLNHFFAFGKYFSGETAS